MTVSVNSLKVMNFNPITRGWNIWDSSYCQYSVLFDIYIWYNMISRDSCVYLPWGMKVEVLLLFTSRNVPPGSTTSYYGSLWIAYFWFPKFSAVKELKNQEFNMIWNYNGGAPPDIGFGRSRNPTRSCHKGSMKSVNLDSNTNITRWNYMDSGCVAILDNQFRGSLEIFITRWRYIGVQATLILRRSMCLIKIWLILITSIICRLQNMGDIKWIYSKVPTSGHITLCTGCLTLSKFRLIVCMTTPKTTTTSSARGDINSF